MTVDPAHFQNLHYEDFKRLAAEDGLSVHERIGFPDAYREGREQAILDDVCGKVTNLDGSGRTILDIGCGCGALALRIIEYCAEREHDLVLVDAAEVLARLPERPHVRKIPGRFPDEDADDLAGLESRVDAVLAYSILHYVTLDTNPFDFLDRAMRLLAHGGELLLGDIPNVSMRRRFFSSPAGKEFHREFTGTQSDPDVVHFTIEPGSIDDSLILGLLLRGRNAGIHGYVLPQRGDLPMANRREDLLFRRP